MAETSQSRKDKYAFFKKKGKNSMLACNKPFAWIGSPNAASAPDNNGHWHRVARVIETRDFICSFQLPVQMPKA
jgi:hypothetical protein